MRLEFNSGFSFSLSRSAPTLAAVLSLVALAVVTTFALFSAPGPAVWGFGLLVGGGFSNLIDRLSSSTHRVTDFISFSSFPTFNAADVAVTGGVVTLLLASLLGRRIVSKS